jgi:hypothetical protein
MCAGEKIGHELLSIIIRFALILLSTLDPASLVRKLTSLWPSILHESAAGHFLHPQSKKPLEGLFSLCTLFNDVRTFIKDKIDILNP